MQIKPALTDIIRVALPVPLNQYFDYRLPPTHLTETGVADQSKVVPGMRVKAPFGKRQLTGIIIEVGAASEFAPEKIRCVSEILEDTSVLSPQLLDMMLWASRYYAHPIGECIVGCLPPPLKKGMPFANIFITQWLPSPTNTEHSLRGKRQKELLALIQQHPKGLHEPFIRSQGFTEKQLHSLAQKALIHSQQVALADTVNETPGRYQTKIYTSEQKKAVEVVVTAKERFQPFLLQGITGSGKTEVYLECIDRLISGLAPDEQQGQALVLIPEINLSPQTLKRFQEHFPNTLILCHHSGLNDTEKLTAWEAARTGQANIIIGTRSAVFYPFANLKVIVVDEEHDNSFKQQEGFRYSARDLAVYRAKIESCPIILGSATPSLESLHNTEQGKYTKLVLRQRPGTAQLPKVSLVDIKTRPLQGGLSTPVLEKIRTHLSQNNQVMVFLNRRGFAPSYTCYSCGWMAECPQCDIRLTAHKATGALHCHHCDFKQPTPRQCPDCNSREVHPQGVGTERTEEFLAHCFSDCKIHRIDRDSTRKKNAMDALYEEIHSGEPCILVGTQMLAKGHHFPNITLVVIVSADDGLFSADIRAEETFSQLLIQVAGRAGRADKAGEVIIQTRQGDNPLLEQICQLDYEALSKTILQTRAAHKLPPYSFLATIRAEADKESDAQGILNSLYHHLSTAYPIKENDLISPPYASIITRKNNRYRYQMLIQCSDRSIRQHFIKRAQYFISQTTLKSSIKLAYDIDPIEIT